MLDIVYEISLQQHYKIDTIDFSILHTKKMTNRELKEFPVSYI